MSASKTSSPNRIERWRAASGTVSHSLSLRSFFKAGAFDNSPARASLQPELKAPRPSGGPQTASISSDDQAIRQYPCIAANHAGISPLDPGPIEEYVRIVGKPRTSNALAAMLVLIERASAVTARVGDWRCYSPYSPKTATVTLYGTSVEPCASDAVAPRGNPGDQYTSDFNRLSMVEPDGIEPTTSSMPLKRSPN